MKKINYIPDSAINLLENDILGTSVYVDVLEKIIENCPTPYTIGLFGSWGSGKSSIIKTLKEKNKDRESVFIYDAWKYSNDEFRRTFLLELAKFSKEKTFEEKLKNRLYESKNRSCKIGLSKFINFETSTTKFFSKITEPEVFEEKFYEIIIKILKDRKLERIVIAIDNIDRCHKEQVLEILLTIKNFLEKPKVIFIIPLDDSGLRKYLQMSQQEANEFIRKIFNSTIHIKSFSDSELYDFGIKLCEKYDIHFNKKENVIDIVTQEFTRNPRKIIQFLNILQTELYLAKIQEEKGLIPKGAVTNNIEFLVKILILRDEYPELYQKVLFNNSLLEEINQSIINNEFNIDKEDKYIKDKIQLTPHEYRFLSRTSHITIESHLMDVFFVVRDVFRNIPDDIYQDIISQNWETLKENLDKCQITVQTLIEFIDTLMDEYVVKKGLYETTGFNLISLIFKIITDKSSEIVTVPKNIISTLNNNRIWSNLYNFPHQHILFSINWLYKKHHLDFRNKIVNELNKLEIKNLNDKSINFINNFISELDGKTISKFKNKFLEILDNNFALYSKFESVIKSPNIKYLINDDFIRKIITQLNQNYTQNQTKEKVEMIRGIKEHNLLSQKTKKEFINKCIENAGRLQNHNDPDLFSFWIESILDYINETDEIIKLYEFIENNHNHIQNLFTHKNFQPNLINVYKLYSKLLAELFVLSDKNSEESRIKNLKSKLQTFLNFQLNEELAKHVNELLGYVIQEADKSHYFLPELISQFISQSNISYKNEIFENIRKIMHKNNSDLSPYERNIYQLIENIFSLNDLQKMNEWLLSLAKNSFCQQKMIDFINEINDNTKLESISRILVSTGLIKNKKIKEKLFVKIKENLASSNLQFQNVGINILYNLVSQNKDLINYKRDVIKPLINEIKSDNFENEIKKKLEYLKNIYI